jgi:hypothetical protein
MQERMRLVNGELAIESQIKHAHVRADGPRFPTQSLDIWAGA